MGEQISKLNWFSITKRYWKEQLFFYILTTLSCLGAFLISANAWKKLLSKEKNFIFEGKFLRKEPWWVWEFKSQQTFIAAMIITIVVACSIVIAHVYYSYYFAKRVELAVKKRLTKKLFALQNPQDRKSLLRVLTNNAQIFSYLVIFVPNQVYYALLDTLLVFILVKEASEKAPSLVWWGIAYYFLILAVIILFQYLVYKKDQPFQKALKEEINHADLLVNKRDLIIKKNLTSSYLTSYEHYLGNYQRTSNRRDFTYTMSFVLPSYSLVRAAGFIFAPFAKNDETIFAVTQLIGLADSTKKMTERLRDYPYGLSAQKQINNFLQQPERNDIQKNILVSEPVENITLKKVSFGYEENKPVLKELDWEFRKGRINYLTGENGFGKSTVISLIMGLYQPSEGEIKINDKYKVSEINLMEWREKIAYAEHESLFENGLSTGQKQLADLNTLFASSENKEVFIFDEADNALDEKNKNEFRQRIEKISQEKLVILISH